MTKIWVAKPFGTLDSCAIGYEATVKGVKDRALSLNKRLIEFYKSITETLWRSFSFEGSFSKSVPLLFLELAFKGFLVVTRPLAFEQMRTFLKTFPSFYSPNGEGLLAKIEENTRECAFLYSYILFSANTFGFLKNGIDFSVESNFDFPLRSHMGLRIFLSSKNCCLFAKIQQVDSNLPVLRASLLTSDVFG